MAFTAIIVDDEPLAIEALRGLFARSAALTVVGEAKDGKSALEVVDRLRPDAVFLDIGMPGLDGMAVARCLRSQPSPPLVVFVTAYDGFAAQAFDLAVVDYVLKPVEAARLERAVERVADRLRGGGDLATARHAEEFWVPSRGGMLRLDIASIDRVEAERDYVRVFASGSSYLLRGSIASIEARLNPAHFLRVHRSVILRRSSIAELRHRGAGAWEAVDRGGRVSNIGRSHLERVRASLGLANS